jgi:hypothetical protein
MTAVENLDYHSVHSGKHLVDADPGRFKYTGVTEFVNYETTPMSRMDLSDDLVLKGLRRRFGIDDPSAEAARYTGDRYVADFDEDTIEVGVYEAPNPDAAIAMELQELEDEEAARRALGGDLYVPSFEPKLPAWGQCFASEDGEKLFGIVGRVGQQPVDELRRGEITF